MTNQSALAVKDAVGATQNIPFPNGNGQAPMAASAPVVIAGDQIVPVSAAALPLPAGAAADGSDGTGITPPAGGAGIRGWLSGIYGRLSNPLPVTGTFWQAIQPVSGTVTANVSGTVPVSGTFWQASQPVSIASMPATAVTGSFWQATQPVSASALPLPSGAAADGNDSTGIAPPTGGAGIRGWLSGIYGRLGNPLSVTGIFWQATQPISGTVNANVSGTVPVSATFWQAVQPVSLASLPALPAGSNSIGAITNGAFGISGNLPAFAATPTVNIGSAPSIAVTGSFYQPTQPVSLSALPPLPAGANLIGAVNLDLGGSAVSITNPLPTIDAYTAPSASAWTSATALNSAGTVATGGYDTVIVTLVGNASLAGGTVAFEVFDGAAWIAVKAASVSDYTTAASAGLTASMNRGYQVPVAGFPQFRVRLAGVISAGSLTITTITSSAPDTSIVTVGLDPAQPLPAGTNAIGTVLGPLPAAPVTGQQTLTTTAVALPAAALQNGLIVTALPANTGTVYVGAAGVTSSSGYPLTAGQSISFAVANASGISIIGTNATDKVAFAGN